MSEALEADGATWATMKRSEYMDRLKFEHELINRRVTWLLSSQSLLLAAYAFALGKGHRLFLMTLAATGIAIALCVLVGILASFTAKRVTWRHFVGLGNRGEPFWANEWITYVGFMPDVALPIVFAIAWRTLFRHAAEFSSTVLP
jgi:hypothetical protein